MIYCPHCGTPNKPNSKFCKNCAALLAPSTDVRCPICGNMNPQSAETCQNCGTRLNTSAAGALNSSDQTTPADTPEQISPFTSPLSSESAETETGDTQSPHRPSFARANSEWLRRIQKTPPASTTPPSVPASSTSAPTEPRPRETPAVPTASDTSTDWLHALDAEQAKATVTTPPATISERPAAETPTAPDMQAPIAELPPTPAASIESAPAADVNAASIASVESEPVTSTEPTATKPALSEIKLTGDDYDYSDIGGNVTDEMKAQLDASAQNLTSTEDEVALARRLLGLDVQEPAAPPIAPPPAPILETPVAEIPLSANIEAAPVANFKPVPVAAVEPTATKPALSEIKLTGDDYDYSDIGGNVTDEMKAQLDASAQNLTSTEDEVALARRLLGLDVQEPAAPPVAAISETPVTEAPPAPVASIEPTPVAAVEPPAARAALSEIKLTGDDYDYSDISGTVTDEMKAQLDASASNLSSTEDEVALARRLLGLDVEEPAASVAAESTLPLETPPPAVAATPTMQTVPEAIAAHEPIAPQEPVAAIEPPVTKPALSEIKLTGDDYDYSDVPGTVTDEMKAQLDASASNLSSTEDEVALARRLLGLDVEEPAAPPPAPIVEMPVAETPPAPIVTTPIAETPPAPIMAVPIAETPPAPVADSSSEVESSPEWLTALAAASSAALAGQAEQETTKIAPTADEPVTAFGPSVVESIAQAPVAESTSEPIEEMTPAAVEAVGEHEITPVAEPPLEIIPAKPAGLESGNLPEWLRELAPREFASNEDAQAPAAEQPAAPTTDSGAPPEWVQELAPGVGTSSTAGMLSHLPDLDETERGDLPDWLREPPEPAKPAAPAAPSPVTGPAPTTKTSDAEPKTQSPSKTPELVPALELPDWFTDSVPGAFGARDPFETIETTGPLAGVSGILPLALAITEAHTLTTATPTRSDGGRIFQTILAEPLAAASNVREQTQTRAPIRAQHLIYLLILLAALIPLFLPLDKAGLGLDAAKSPTAEFYDQLQAVPANGTVLLAFDYTPGQAVELDPAARAIVNELVAHKVNVIALSSQENGATLGQTILSRAQEQQPQFSFVNIGYIPGEANLRVLAKGWLPANHENADGTLWGASPLAAQVHGMNDLALTIVFVGDDNILRSWVEQVKPNITTPMIAATSAQLEPQVRNYVNAKQLNASLRGLTGAAELELLTNSAGQAVKTVDAYSFVTLALAGIIIMANIMWLLNRGKKTK